MGLNNERLWQNVDPNILCCDEYSIITNMYLQYCGPMFGRDQLWWARSDANLQGLVLSCYRASMIINDIWRMTHKTRYENSFLEI